MRIWFKMMKGTHLIKDMTVTDESDDTRTHKIFKALDEVCYAFDLGKPIWFTTTPDNKNTAIRLNRSG